MRTLDQDANPGAGRQGSWPPGGQLRVPRRPNRAADHFGKPTSAAFRYPAAARVGASGGTGSQLPVQSSSKSGFRAGQKSAHFPMRARSVPSSAANAHLRRRFRVVVSFDGCWSSSLPSPSIALRCATRQHATADSTTLRQPRQILETCHQGSFQDAAAADPDEGLPNCALRTVRVEPVVLTALNALSGHQQDSLLWCLLPQASPGGEISERLAFRAAKPRWGSSAERCSSMSQRGLQSAPASDSCQPCGNDALLNNSALRSPTRAGFRPPAQVSTMPRRQSLTLRRDFPGPRMSPMPTGRSPTLHRPVPSSNRLHRRRRRRTDVSAWSKFLPGLRAGGV